MIQRRKKVSMQIKPYGADRLSSLRDTDDRWKRRGMLTVEASFIIPMAVLAAGIMLSLCFHVYQGCWYTQASCEIVLAGSTQGVLKGCSGVEKAQERWSVLEEEFYLLPHNLSGEVSGGKDELTMKVSGTTPVWGRCGFSMNVSTEQKLVRPVTFIRKIAALKKGERT